MQAKLKEKKKAILLRKRGFSYREILTQVPVAKSSLSLWLKEVGLSKEQKQRLTKKKLESALRGAQKRKDQRIEKTRLIIESASNEIGSLSQKEQFILGVGLYWAEGSKEKTYGKATSLIFTNSDLCMVLFYRKWVLETFGINNDRLKYDLCIHENADWKKAREWWADFLKIDKNNISVYFKKHNIKTRRKNVGDMYNGLIRIRVTESSDLNRKVAGWVKGVCK